MRNEVILGNQSSAEYADTDFYQPQRGATSRMERRDHALNPSFVLTPDKTNLFVQDWGSGLPVLFLAAWTLDSSVWGSHIASLVRHGFKCLAVDRRGHGRSDAPCFWIRSRYVGRGSFLRPGAERPARRGTRGAFHGLNRSGDIAALMAWTGSVASYSPRPQLPT